MIYSQSVLYSCDAARETIEKDMEICIFYSWQSRFYKDDCDKIIRSALVKAARRLNRDQKDYHYWIRRGGGNVVGSGEITPKIEESLKFEANIIVSDYTHIGPQPLFDSGRQKWDTVEAIANMNVVVETTKGSAYLGVNGNNQVIKVSNAAYGEYGVNLSVNFDNRQERFPLQYKYKSADGDDKEQTIVSLRDRLIKAIKEGSKDYLENQKIRFSPFTPIMYELKKKKYSELFLPTKKFEDICQYIIEGKSFRVLGLPGLGKTRLVCEAFKGRDYDVSYCDCKDQSNKDITNAFEALNEKTKKRQTVVLDNCSKTLNTTIHDLIYEKGYNCMVITVFYDAAELVDTGLESVLLEVGDNDEVIRAIVDQNPNMPEADKKTIVAMSGGFPLMAKMMCSNFVEGRPISDVRIGDIYERILNINKNVQSDIDRLKVMTAYALFKVIGMYEAQAKQGRFVANNKIITPLDSNDEEHNFQLFLSVFRKYSNVDILERHGNLVTMRLIPLAIYLCKMWFDEQDTDSIRTLIDQMMAIEDEGTKNILIESIARRITLLSGVPLAKTLHEGLTNKEKSPFLKEEVVLTKLGSRLFLAFSEVNPESCGEAVYRIIWPKTDAELYEVDRETRRNLAWALDHLAFDHRSFRNAMLTLARFSLVETEGNLSNNTTGLFIERFPVLLPATETPLMERIEILKELSIDERYRNLIKRSLLMALNINHDYRSGGAEKQGLKSLTDYIPETYDEIYEYYSVCLDMLLDGAQNDEDFDEICKTVAQCARGYYYRQVDKFLLRALEILVPKKNYVWEEMRDALTYIVKYDGKKRGNWKIDEIEAWRQKLTQDDYVYRLEHASRRLDMEYDLSFDKEMELIAQSYEELAKELIDHHLYEDDKLLAAVMRSKTLYLNRYGITLSEYAKEKGIQEELLGKLLAIVLNGDASKDGESLFYYYFWKVDDKVLTEWVYDEIQKSRRRYLLTAVYALKGEGKDKLAHLFELLDKGEITVDDFGRYYTYMPFVEFNVKYVSKRLLDYGDEGAAMVMSRCGHLLYDEEPKDKGYQEIARNLLLRLGLKGVMIDDLHYMDCVKKYLGRNRDDELALHIQKITEDALKDAGIRENYYLGRLYRQVLLSYKDLLKHRVFELMEDDKAARHWVSLMRTSFPQEKGEGDSMYTIITDDEWFEWLENGGDTDGKAFTLAMMFSYSNGEGKANPVMVRLLDKYYNQTVICGLSARFHSFGWTGTGIPLYRERIAICKDYAVKLQNEEAKQWFLKDIPLWEEHIQEELLRNAHERAIYDDY